MLNKAITWIVKRRLGSFRQALNTPDLSRPINIESDCSVSVLGSGLAGISAAYHLAKRGFQVTLIEKESYIGGKVGSWKYNNNNVEHGFHAFFRQYYNLREFLKEIDCYKHLIPISDYKIKFLNEREQTFADLPSMPIVNILAMRKKGFYSIKSMLRSPKSTELLALLKYDSEKTTKQYDQESFLQFAERVSLPPKMRIVFNTFARAFFAEPENISMAELIKGMHFYFLSNTEGLLYDVLDDDFENTLLSPIRKELLKLNVKLQLNTEVTSVEVTGNGVNVNGMSYNYCVIATHEAAAKMLLNNSKTLSGLIMQEQKPTYYAVLRLWMDIKIGENEPYFVFTDRIELLDSITFYHEMEKESAAWAKKNNGGVYELHAYSIPKHLENKTDVRKQLIKELFAHYPQLKNASILDEYFQFRNDFTSFHVNKYSKRPKTKTTYPKLFFAGDWVKLNTPAMLMEGAYTSGALAANEVLREHGLQEVQLYTVPQKGVFA